MDIADEKTTFSVCVSGIKGTGKRTFVNAITENKRTSKNIPVLTLKDPKNDEYTLCFIVNNIIAKGVHISGPKIEDKPRWAEEQDKSMKVFNSAVLPNCGGLNIYMYDISNHKSFQILKDQIEKSYIRDSSFGYIIGNKSDAKDSRQVDFDDAKVFAVNNGMLFTEISSVTKKNIEMVVKLLKNGVFQSIKNAKKQAPKLPPRDPGLDEIDDDLYENSDTSNFEKKLVQKMYKGRIDTYEPPSKYPDEDDENVVQYYPVDRSSQKRQHKEESNDFMK
jgi:hypothetical protein